jgi:hypothetical protein
VETVDSARSRRVPQIDGRKSPIRRRAREPAPGVVGAFKIKKLAPAPKVTCVAGFDWDHVPETLAHADERSLVLGGTSVLEGHLMNHAVVDGLERHGGAPPEDVGRVLVTPTSDVARAFRHRCRGASRWRSRQHGGRPTLPDALLCRRACGRADEASCWAGTTSRCCAVGWSPRVSWPVGTGIFASGAVRVVGRICGPRE